MKISNYFYTLLILNSSFLWGQNNAEEFFLIKPSEIIQKNEIEQYNVTLKWQNINPINEANYSCNAVKALYIAGLNDSVSWKKVSLAQISDLKQKEYEGVDLLPFNNFSYKSNNSDFLKEDFYKVIPPEQRDLAKWLVSDAFQMHGLVNYIFDNLEFNKEYSPEFLENYDIKFEDWVTFSSRYQKLIWSGITKYNNEICAIVKFESYFNPVKMDNSEMSFKGRSLYWGEIWISLIDKQVEYASMVEDVVFKLKSTQFPEEQLIDLQREVTFDKIN